MDLTKDSVRAAALLITQHPIQIGLLLIWAKSVLLLLSALLRMRLRELYLHCLIHGKQYLTAALLGAIISLSISRIPFIALPLSAQTSLLLLGRLTQRSYLQFSILLLFVWTLVITWSTMVNYWRRYLRTSRMSDRATVTIDLIALAIVTGGLIFNRSPSNYVLPVLLPDLLTRAFYLGLLFYFAATFIRGRFLYRSDETPSSTEIARPRISNAQTVVAYSDEPISRDADDLLGRTNIVDQLYRQVVMLPGADSFVFGLSAGWGEGKTSVLNLLRNRLKGNPSVLLVDFNPWYFATELGMIENFYDQIEAILRSRYLIRNLRRILARYLSLLSMGLRSSIFGVELRPRENPMELRSRLESFILRSNHKLVILIDDIDRLTDPRQALAALTLTRLSARLRNTVFIISYDQRALLGLLKDLVEPDFLSKIIQQPLVLPTINQTDINNFLFFSEPSAPRSAIDCLLDDLEVPQAARKLFDDLTVPFYSRYARTLFGTLRDAKRFVNVLRAGLPPVVAEVNLFDFFLLTLLEVFFPAVYRDIWEHLWIYLPPWDENAVLFPFYVLEADKQQAARKKHVETLVKQFQEAETLQKILSSLFFCIDDSFGRWIQDRSTEELVCREQQRITHPWCFPKYFYRQTPRGRVADDEVRQVINHWNTATSAHKVVEDIQEYKRKGTLPEFFDIAFVLVKDFSPNNLKCVFDGVVQCVPFFSREKEFLGFRSEYRGAAFLLFRLAAERAESPEMLSLLQVVIRKSPSLDFVARFVGICNEDIGVFRVSEH
jgi:KAP-like P-loop domain-containing protein